MSKCLSPSTAPTSSICMKPDSDLAAHVPWATLSKSVFSVRGNSHEIAFAGIFPAQIGVDMNIMRLLASAGLIGAVWLMACANNGHSVDPGDTPKRGVADSGLVSGTINGGGG